MSAQHTPGPWVATAEGLSVHPLLPDERVGPAICMLYTKSGALDNHDANARRIVQCVNAHDLLVEALEELLDSDVPMPPAEAGVAAQNAWANRRCEAVIQARGLLAEIKLGRTPVAAKAIGIAA